METPTVDFLTGCGLPEEEVQANLTLLGQTAKKVPGKLYSDYAVHGDELLFFDVHTDPSAFDAHIGLCFPFFAPMTAHTTMQFIRGSCDGNQLDWWKKSCSAWAASRFWRPVVK